MSDRSTREIEVKLEVVDRRAILTLFDARAGIEGLGFWADGAVTDRTVVDRYLDTADGRLAAAGLGARLRAGDGRQRLTVKSRPAARDQPIHDRLELEAAAGPEPDPATWPRSAARTRLEQALGDGRLAVIARIRQQRRSLAIRRGSTVVELSLDDLEALALAEDVVLARSTALEAELLAGAERDLELLALGLLRLPGLRAATRSKLDWALEALAGRPPEPGARNP